MRPDDFTAIRLAAKPLWRDHFHNLAGIWADDAAVEMAIASEDLPDKLVIDADNWDGMDGPPRANFWSPGISSHGETLTSSKILGRTFTLPLFVPHQSPALLTALDSHMYAWQPMVVGLQAAQAADNRYLIGCWQQQPSNRQARGISAISRIGVFGKSHWGYMVSPHLQTEADAFTPSGEPWICWAVELTAISALTTTITITPSGTPPVSLTDLPTLDAAASLTITWSTSWPTRMLVIPSPPFRAYHPYRSETARYRLQDYRHTRIGALPAYLQPGQTYSVSATNATASLCWLENHPRQN